METVPDWEETIYFGVSGGAVLFLLVIIEMIKSNGALDVWVSPSPTGWV